MNVPRGTTLKRWIWGALVIGIVPSALYLAFIHPKMLQIADYQNRVRLRAKYSLPAPLGPAPATDREQKQLEQVRHHWLARIKKISNRESLLRFSASLTDALALQARHNDLRVISADLQNSFISGKYVPADERALETLSALPSPQWKELTVPLDLPMLHLPSIEICMTVSGDYSRVFSFIESLPDFPSHVNLTGLGLTQNQEERAFQLKIRGYYYGIDPSEPSSNAEHAG